MRWTAGLDRIGSAALARPGLALAVLAVVMAVAAIALPRLRFDDDINRVFLSQSPLSQAQLALEASFDPPSSDIVALIESDTPMAMPALSVLRDLSLDVELEDGVLAVLSPFAARMPPEARRPRRRFSTTASMPRPRCSLRCVRDLQRACRP